MFKLGVVIHPGYYGDISFNVTYYKKIASNFKKYDKVFVYFPDMSDEYANRLFEYLVDYIIDDYIGGFRDNIIDRYLEKHYLHLLKESNIIPEDIICGFNVFDKRTYLENTMIDNFKKILNDDIRILNVFKGVNIKDIDNTILNKLYDMNDEYDNVENIFLGSVEVIADQSSEIYKDIPKDTVIDLFGVFANQCVRHHDKTLHDLGYKTRVISKLSIYTHKGKSLDGYNKLKDNKYYHVVKEN